MNLQEWAKMVNYYVALTNCATFRLVGRVGLEPTTHGTQSEVTIIYTMQVNSIVKAIGRKGEKSNIMCSTN